MKNSDIIRIQEKIQNGLHSIQVLGLNIFQGEEDLDIRENLPFEVFLREMLKDRDEVVIHQGSLAIKHYVEYKKSNLDVYRFFGRSAKCFNTNISVNSSAIYNGDDYDNPLSYLIKAKVEELQFEFILDELMEFDSTCIYFFNDSDEGFQLLKKKLDAFESEESLLSEMTNYAYMLWSFGDLQAFEVITRSPDTINKVRDACDKAVHVIGNCKWFKKNKDKFYWDDGPSACWSVKD